MPDYLAQVHEPARPGVPARVRQVRLHADHPQAVARLLGVPAASLLSVRPVQPVQPVSPANAGATKPAATPASRGPWGRQRFDLRLFSQELAVLLEAGIPLLEALQTLREKDGANTAAGPLDSVIAALCDGQPLSAALAHATRTHQPPAFDALFIALVAASERSGQLAVTLRDHAAYLAWSGALKGKLQAALVYPLMLLGAGGAVILFLLLYVLPRFAGVFDGLGRDLPAASRWLIDLGVLAAAHPGAALGLAAALPATAVLLWQWPATRAALPGLLWRSPGLGPHLRLVALARLYRALGLLLAAGVPAPAALHLLNGVLAAPLRAALAQVRVQVQSGLRLSQALHSQHLATPVALRMVRVGEQSGELPAMLARAAAFHDEQIARLSDLVTRLVNPVLMLVMGVLIGGIVVLMYLPIFTLMETVQ